MKLRLLKDIFSKEGIDVRGKWAPRLDSPLYFAPEVDWWTFSEHIKWQSRFLFGIEHSRDPKNWLPQFLPLIERKVSTETHFYRARLGHLESDTAGFEPLPNSQMFAPPKEKTTKGGRANPPGISFLYVAEEMATAIAETKPYIGAFVSGIAFKPKRDLKIVDLVSASPLRSPFGYTDLPERMLAIDYARCLDSELAEPVSPETDTIDYVPSQYVVEVIRNADFDGVRYHSAMSKGGHNVVFFNPNDLNPVGKPALHRVQELTVSSIPFKFKDAPPF